MLRDANLEQPSVVTARLTYISHGGRVEPPFPLSRRSRSRTDEPCVTLMQLAFISSPVPAPFRSGSSDRWPG